MDNIKRMLSNKYGLSVVYVDVSETAKELEKRHLSGPASSMALGQALLAVSLISIRLKGEKERLSFQLKVDGPIGGVLVEAGANGELRGYTDVKLLDSIDGNEELDMEHIMGDHGILSVMHSNDSKVIYSGQTNVSPADIRTAVARYFNLSEQIPTGLELYSDMIDFRVNHMTGIMVQKMPGADTEKFVEILEKLGSEELREVLKGGMDLKKISGLFGTDDLALLDTKALKFACHCSQEKSLSIMGTLKEIELQEIIKSGEPQKITCHFCGETYVIKAEELHSLLLGKADMKKPM
ncbi:MAG: Hsp33 family molecular chaperone HslO [bacterium]|nr:Hsp33 family molecular chaperone HslO [bacterium]